MRFKTPLCSILIGVLAISLGFSSSVVWDIVAAFLCSALLYVILDYKIKF